MTTLKASGTQAEAGRWATLLILLCNLGLATAVPCGTGWAYDSSIGWCLQHVATPHNWTEARAHCSRLVGPGVGARSAGARLGAPTTTGGAKAVSRFLTNLGNFGDMWVAAMKVAGAYQWIDQTPPGNVTTGWSSSPDTRECVYMRSIAKNVDGTDWKAGVELKTADCGEMKQFFCFYQAKHCNLGELKGYNAETMDLQLQAANIGEATTANCRAGFYRQSVMLAVLRGTGSTTAASSGTSPAPNSVNCTDTSTSSDPELASPVWLQGDFEECLRVGCSTDYLKELGIQNAMSFSDALTRNTYNFGDGFNVTCKKGYVSSTDGTSKVARVNCMQDPIMTWLGTWLPSSSDVCSPIKCTSMQTLLANYSGVRAVKAFNAERNRWYSALEMSQFSDYSTEVYIACNGIGLFFQDQKYERQMACEVENDTSTRANWVGIRGTFMVRGVLQNIYCIEVVCNLVDMFHLLDERGSVLNQWASYHINDGVTVYDAATHTVSNLTKTQLSSIGSFLYGSSISVTCPSDRLFVQSGTDQENLVLNLMQMTVTCTKTGKWNQTLGMCIERTAAIQLLGRQKQYVPPAKEANAAWQMGVVTISIVIIFFACIVILDLATIKRDFNLLKTNLFYLRLRLRHL